MTNKDQLKLGICGHFGFNKNLLNGQTVKTNMLTAVLEQEFGKNAITQIDTHGGLKRLPVVLLQLLRAFYRCFAVIMLPAHNGVQLFAPFFVIFGTLLHCRILYVVIGGWLPEMTLRKKWLAYFLKKFDAIYVETSSMKVALNAQEFKNVYVMPNFKDLSVLEEKDLVYTTNEPFAFCTFSRVMKEKGIEDAVSAVTRLNTQAGRTVATLDIYGQIDTDYQARFEALQADFPSYIHYKGTVPADQSVAVLKNYFALLFPTYYSGEGFAGTLLDALAAGIPVIASDWKYNKEIVVQNKTGVIMQSSLEEEIQQAVAHADQFNALKPHCLQEAQNYLPRKVVVPQILAYLEGKR